MEAFNSPETEPQEVEEDRGYSRHKLKKDPVGPKSSSAVAPRLVVTPPRLTRSALTDILAKDQAQPEKDETPKEKEKPVPTSKAAKNMKANVSERKRRIDEKDGMALYRAGMILIPTDEDLGAPETTKKTSTIVSALQDITNTYDEKSDHEEVTSQATPVRNSRRRSYKAKTPIKVLEPTSAQISVFAVGRAAMRDSLLNVTATIKAKAAELLVNTPRKLRVDDNKIRVEGSNSATAGTTSTAKKVNARMRTYKISEEEQVPEEGRVNSPATETTKQPMNVYSAKRKQKEEMKREDDYNDAHEEVSYNDEKDAEKGEEKVMKKGRISVDDEATKIVLIPKVPNSNPREGVSQNAVGTATSWRPNVSLTTFASSDASSTDDSANKEVDRAAFTVTPSAVNAEGDADKTDHRRKSKKPEVIKPSSPVESSQEDDADSTYSRLPLASQDSENRDPKAWEPSKRGRDIDSGSDGDEPSSDEDGVIAM